MLRSNELTVLKRVRGPRRASSRVSGVCGVVDVRLQSVFTCVICGSKMIESRT